MIDNRITIAGTYRLLGREEYGAMRLVAFRRGLWSEHQLLTGVADLRTGELIYDQRAASVMYGAIEFMPDDGEWERAEQMLRNYYNRSAAHG